ncbi:putative Diguanylate cyclase [Candidatus Contendobacter odensis Run_B_J11]|uniref:Diguanylate cyclase n=1 Tax=Candidatus Contendobacter odensis Run_B_J11 TaxID=1400861 RepID=A0A7U7J2H9_9GAMM|nr:putative Diguanylate cyclase [Candidatus Contendobacter odensis Run_B_J11]
MQSPPDAVPTSGFPAGEKPGFSRRWEPEQRRWLAVWIVYFVLWYAAWFGSVALGAFGNSISLWYPPAGLRFFALLTFGWRAVLPVLLTEGSLGVLLWATGPSPFPLMPAALGNYLEATLSPVGCYLLAALALRTWNVGRTNNNFADQTHTGRFLSMALLGGVLAAGVGAARLLRTDFIASSQFPEAWFYWLVGDFIGVITLTPLMLVHLSPRLRDWLQWGRWRQPFPQAQRKPWWLWPAYLAGLLLTLVILFKLPLWLGLGGPRPFPTLFILLPLAWIAIAGGLSVSTLAIFALDAGLAFLVAWHRYQDVALYYQLVMIAVALMGLLLGGVTEARDRAFDLYRDLSRVSNDLLWDTNEDGRLTQLNGELAWELAPSLGRWWRTGIRAIPVECRKMLSAAIQARRPFREVMLSVCNHAGELRWLRVNGLPYRDDLGRFAGYRGAATDVTSQYQAERLLAGYTQVLQREVSAKTTELQRINRDLVFSEQRYRTMLAAAPVGVAEVDAAGRCQYVNFPWCVLTGQAATAVLGHSWLEGIHPSQRSEAEQLMETRQNRRTGDGEFQGLADQWLSVHWSTLYDGDGAITGAIVILNDITDRRLREQENWELAHFDALTQLPNRILFWDRLEYALRLASRNRQLVALLWLDLDGFKAINDTLGHAAGDELLRQVSQRLQASLRESDTAARMGGDEFTVVLATVAHPEDAIGVAQKIIDQIHQPFTLPQGLAQVSTSIGVALYPDHASTAKELVHCADLAMYAAKNAGKNGWRLWDGDAEADRAEP